MFSWEDKGKRGEAKCGVEYMDIYNVIGLDKMWHDMT